MTSENLALLADMFRRYGLPAEDAQIQLSGYFTKAETMKKADYIQLADENAVRLIQECQAAIAQLTAYRIALAERYNFLATAPTVPVVRLYRERNSYDKKVYYYLCTLRRFVEDGTETEESRQKYPGTERRKALADFRAYVNAHPGIVAETAIEKGYWEK